MGSETPLRLPVIDFTLLDKNDQNNTPFVWNLLKSLVYQALQEYGCFEASFNRVPTEVRKLIFESLEQLFDLPLETKQRNVSEIPFHGYLGHPTVPLYESMGIEDALSLKKVESFATLMWPQGNPDFCKNIQTFCEKISGFDRMVRKMVVESLGLEKYLDEHIELTNYLLRVMKYKGPETTESTMGLNAHTDKNMLTILHQNQVEGLEIQIKGGEWIRVQPSPNSFIVMAGESLYAWTNGRVHAPYHRVVMTGNEARFSLGLFSVPKGGYTIKVPDEIVDEQHPLLFKPFDYGEFVKFYHTNMADLTDKQSALKTYCGV